MAVRGGRAFWWPLPCGHDWTSINVWEEEIAQNSPWLLLIQFYHSVYLVMHLNLFRIPYELYLWVDLKKNYGWSCNAMTPIKTFRLYLRLSIKHWLAVQSQLLPDGEAAVKIGKNSKTWLKIFLRQNLTFRTPRLFFHFSSMRETIKSLKKVKFYNSAFYSCGSKTQPEYPTKVASGVGNPGVRPGAWCWLTVLIARTWSACSGGQSVWMVVLLSSVEDEVWIDTWKSSFITTQSEDWPARCYWKVCV